jgi:diguanylate cyclase (GGDEF)-like protein
MRGAPPITADAPNLQGPRAALLGIARSIRELQLLLLLVTALYFFVAQGSIAQPTLWFVTLLVFGIVALGSPALGPLRHQPRLQLCVDTVVMVLFITALIGQAGASPGPLSHLYLLPVVIAALLLGRGMTWLLLALILVGRLVVGLLTSGVASFSLSQAVLLFAELAPTVLVAILTSALARNLDKATRTIQFLAERDDLTGLLNLRSFSLLASDELRRAESSAEPAALLIVDVEMLREINDRFGHEAGDRALCAVTESLKRATRTGDLCGRYGGDEFVLFLPRCSAAAAEVVANRIRHDVYSATQDFEYAMRRLTVQVGSAVWPDNGHDLRSLFREAHRAVRQEKQARRPAFGSRAG